MASEVCMAQGQCFNITLLFLLLLLLLLFSGCAIYIAGLGGKANWLYKYDLFTASF